MLKRLKNKNIIWAASSFALPVICLVLLGIITGIGVGSRSVLMWDAETQYINFLGYLQNILQGKTNELFYSLSITPGEGNILVVGYYMLSPFNLILVLFSKASLPYAFMIIQLIKIGLCGLCMYFYLINNIDRNKLSDVAILIISLCYALNGYIAVYMANIMWLDGVFILPIMADGVRKLIREKRCVQYYLALAYAIITNFYMGYMLAIFSAIYLAYVIIERIFVEKCSVKGVGYSIGKYIITSIMAIGTTSAILIPIIYQLLKSKISGSEGSRSITYLFREVLLVVGVLIFLLLLYLGERRLKKIIKDKRIYAAIKFILEIILIVAGWKFIQNMANKSLIDKRFFTWPFEMLIGAEDGTNYFPYELAHLYIGIFPFAVMLLSFVDKRRLSVKRFIDVIMFILLILMLACYDINIMMHGFSYPIGSPHRWTFIMSFCQLVIVAEYLSCRDNERILPSIKDIDIYAIVILLVIGAIAIKCYKEYDMTYMHPKYVILSILLFAIYYVIMFLFSSSKLFMIILPIVCVELCINIALVLGSYEFLSYNDYEEYIQITEVLEQIITKTQVNEGRADEVFRVESEVKPNYYYIFNYPSLYHYSSALTSVNHTFMAGLGYKSEFAYQVINNMNVSADIAGFCGIKYLISDGELSDNAYSLIYSNAEKNVYLYENTRALPMTFVAMESIGDVDYSEFVDEDAVTNIVENYGNQEYYLKSSPLSHYNCCIRCDEKNNSVYFLIPYDSGWHATVDGKNADIDKAFGYYMRINELSSGEHHIDIYYIPPYSVIGIIIAVFTVIVSILATVRTKNLTNS